MIFTKTKGTEKERDFTIKRAAAEVGNFFYTGDAYDVITHDITMHDVTRRKQII